MRVQKDERKKQRERNRQRHNQRSPNADQKKNQHDENQHHPAQQVGLHGVRREPHQIAAIVERTHLDIRRQNPLVDFLRFRLDALQHGLGLLAAAHQDHAFHRVVHLVETEFTEPRRVPDGHVAHVANAHRDAVLCSHDDARDIRLVANQPQPAHVVELAALRIKSAAGIGVVDSKLRHHLRHRDVIAIQARRIEKHLILHHRAAESRIVRHASHLLVLPLDHPILVSLELLR